MTLTALAIARLAYGLMLPTMRAELGLSVAQAGHIGTSLSLGYLILVLPAGLIASRYGPKHAIVAGLVCISCSCVALSGFGSYTALLLIMLLMGCGTALLYTPMIALIVGWFPARRGTIIGVANSGVGIGMLAIGAYAPWLIERFGKSAYRFAWFSFALFALLLLFLIVVLVRNPPAAKAPQAATTAGKPGALRSVLGNPGVRAIAVVYALLGVSYIVQSVFMISYAVESGISQARAGVMFSTMGLVSILAGTVWGTLSDYLGRGRALMLNFTITLMVTALPVFIPTDTGFFTHFLISGLTVGGLFTIILAATSECVEPRIIPVAVATVTIALALGQLVGPLGAGLLIEWSGYYQPAFIASSLMMLLGVIFSRRLARYESQRKLQSA